MSERKTPLSWWRGLSIWKRRGLGVLAVGITVLTLGSLGESASSVSGSHNNESSAAAGHNHERSKHGALGSCTFSLSVETGQASLQLQRIGADGVKTRDVHVHAMLTGAGTSAVVNGETSGNRRLDMDVTALGAGHLAAYVVATLQTNPAETVCTLATGAGDVTVLSTPPAQP